jgi:hypothetical protein
MTLRKKWALGTTAGGAIGLFVGLWVFFSGDPANLATFKAVLLTIAGMLEIIGIKLAWPGDPPE